jgi:hypothetical protein
VPNQIRRNFIKTAIASLFLLSVPACHKTIARNNEPIYVNLDGVKDLQGLVTAAKQAGGSRLPNNIAVEEYYIAIADTFVSNARQASEMGLKVPNWVLDKLPKKVAVDSNKVKPEYVALTLLGVMLVFPIVALFTIVFASILTMTRYITNKLNDTST